MELQRFELKPEQADDGIRLARELWQILRRKQGCMLHHLYHSADHDGRWMAYSEWQSLNELGGARKELARSPAYRRLHSMLKMSSERAYEPFGAIRSLVGTNFGGKPSAVVFEFKSEPEDPEQAFGFFKTLAGYVSHVLTREVGESKTLACIAHFESEQNAAAAKAELESKLKTQVASIEMFAA